MLCTPVSITSLAFDVAWHAARLDDKPPALTVPSPGSTFTERRLLEQQGWEELHRLGLAQHGRLHGDASDALVTLGGASRELYGFFGGAEDEPRSVIAASRGDDAVLALLDDGCVTMESVRATNLAEAVLSVLPRLNKAPGPALSAPLSAAHGDAAEGGSVLQRSDGGTGDAAAGQRMRRALDRPRIGGGQFYSAGRDRWGKRGRNPALVSMVDTVDGRYIAETRPSDRGEPWVILAPADNGALMRAFNGLLGALR